MNTNHILLTVAIPTYNRAKWLDLCLSVLIPQLAEANEDVEVTIYDNASPDDTESVARRYLKDGLSVKYFRNFENIGSDRNIAQCFNKSLGRYVLILGDDDVVTEGSLKKLLDILRNDSYQHGAIYIRAYGYDLDYKKERPFQLSAKRKIYTDTNAFMAKCSSNMAFISSLVINKSIIPTVDANQFLNTALVQTYVFYEAVRSAKTNLYIDEYWIAAKRIEQRDYDVTKVFSSALNDALNYFVSRGLAISAVNKINRKMLWYFFPFFLLQLRKSSQNVAKVNESYQLLKSRYHQELLFWLCAAPILKWPLAIARLWASLIIILSRLLNGEIGKLYIVFRDKLSFTFKSNSKTGM